MKLSVPAKELWPVSTGFSEGSGLSECRFMLRRRGLCVYRFL